MQSNASWGDWLKHEFRGWSIVHFILDATLAGMLGVIATIIPKIELWQGSLFMLFGGIAITCMISLWLRRGEDVYESRWREQPGIRDDVQKAYRELADRAARIDSIEDAKQFRKQLLDRMEMQLYAPRVSQFSDLLNDIQHRTDFRDILLSCSTKLNAMTDTLHYSDIKRHPRR